MFLPDDDATFLRLIACYEQSFGVTTDTRAAQRGQVFFALKGDNFNGNQYAMKALELGCSAAIVDEPSELPLGDPRIIVVPNVLHALQSLARWRRRQWPCPVIGLTGSNGKTTTKELLKCVLEQKFEYVHATVGNLNNEIGVPLTILAAQRTPDIAVIEMGANAQGEIALLASIAEPNAALITNIGRAHLEGFGGEEGVLRGKGELFDFLRNHAAPHKVFVHGDHPKLLHISEGLERMVYGVAKHPPFVSEVLSERTFTWIDLQGILQGPVDAHMSGAHNRDNAMAATAVGLHFGVSPEACSKALSNYVPSNNRSQWIQTKRNHVLLDAYNANPSSMLAALRAFHSETQNSDPSEPGICILGDMAELGPFTAEAHREVLHAAVEGGFNVITVGRNFMDAALQHGGEVTRFLTTSEAAAFIEEADWNQRRILLKGSRSIALESLVNVL